MNWETVDLSDTEENKSNFAESGQNGSSIHDQNIDLILRRSDKNASLSRTTQSANTIHEDDERKRIAQLKKFHLKKAMMNIEYLRTFDNIY